jgi:enolase-phosphatase E1
MAQDLKIPYLKSLQGYLWRRGYATGELKCPLFGDVAPQLRTWHARGLPVIIYSSGSVEAQKLLLAHTTEEEGDLTGPISGYFDTVNAGMKQERKSYEVIVQDGKNGDIEPARWVFVSDNVAEVDAAREAGLKGVVIVREGNTPLSEEERARHVVVESLEKLRI